MPLSSVKIKDDDRVNMEPTTVAGISAFLGKLWKMVEDTNTDELISWGKAGNTFVIKNQIDFAKTILPNYYKHNNIASFIRQLNMYGFHKIISTTSGALDSTDNDEIEFTHPCFVRGHPYLLEQIKRKMNNPKENVTKNEPGNQFNDSIKKVLIDIRNLKGKQEHLGSQLSAVKQENEILWRELSLLRQKHAAQQNVLNKLIRFLVSLAQPSNHGIVKRRLVPLMLKDSSSIRTKQEPIFQEGDHVYSMKKHEAESPGPIIHEIHPSEMLDNVQIIETPVMEVSAESPVMLENEIITSPPSSVAASDMSIPSPEPVPAALFLSNSIPKGKSRIQTVYVPTSQQMPTHYLISQPARQRDQSPEYLIPDQTNPLMELVQETIADDDNEYITVVTSDGTDIISDNAQTSLDDDNGDLNVADKLKRKPGRKITRKITTPVVKTVPAKLKSEVKKKPVASEEKLDENDFLIDIGLADPATSTTKLDDNILSAITETDPSLKEAVPINVEDIMHIPSVAGASNMTPIVIPISDANIIQRSPKNTSSGSIQGSLDDVFNLATENTNQISDKSKLAEEAEKSANDALMKEIDECIDNAHNMKIACTDNNTSSRNYVDDISMQLDTMQTDINYLKDMLMQNENITVDMLGLFNEDPMDYNMPMDSSSSFPKASDKIMGNELISAPSMFDFNDIFANGDWSQPATPLSTTESDYCNLNTPQIESGSTEPTYPPPAKKIKIN